jgi:methylglyoxal synthase
MAHLQNNHVHHAMANRKRIAMVAHDNRKKDLLDWAKYNKDVLAKHHLLGTGTTGRLLADELNLYVETFKSGPLGGDQQIGASIAEGKIDAMIFFWDPLQAQPHDVDVKALLRLAVLYNIPLAMNRSTADFMISSELIDEAYDRYVQDYGSRIKS